MSDKYYVGGDITSFSDNGRYKPISRVTLLVDDENSLTAGDDTGMEIVSSCPHATQPMVNALLQTMKGYQYQAYEAGAANIDPAAELGDGVTVAGVYSPLSKISDDGRGYAGISSPGEAEMEDEYPSGGYITQEFNRKIAETRSFITKTSEEIMLKVEGIDGRVTSLSTSIDGIEANISSLNGSITNITADINGLRTTVSGKIDGKIAQSMIDQSVNKIELRVDGVDNDISTLRVELGNVQSEVSGKIDGSTAQSLINQSIDKIELSVSSGSNGSTFTLKAGSTTLSTNTLDLHVNAVNIDGTLKASQIQAGGIYVGDLADGSDYATKTYVTDNAGLSQTEVDERIGTYIDETSITAETLRGRTVELLASNSRKVGTIELIYTTTGDGIGMYTEQGGISIESAGNVYISSAYRTRLQLDDDAAKIGPTVWATDGHIIYSSDKNVKNSIDYDLSRYRQFLLDLKPCRFKYNEGQSGRYHIGMIAQDMEQSLADNGIAASEFSGWCKMPIRDENHNITGYTYGIRYDSLIPLNTLMIQELVKRVEALERRS